MDEKLWGFEGLWGFTERSDVQGGSQKTNIEGGLPKKGELGQFADLRVGLGKKLGGGVFFVGGWGTHYGYGTT